MITLYRCALCVLLACIAACDTTPTEELEDEYQVVMDGVVTSEGAPIPNAAVTIEMYAPDCAGDRFPNSLELVTDTEGRFKSIWGISFSREQEFDVCAVAEAASGGLTGMDSVHTVAVRWHELVPDTGRFLIMLGS